MTDRDQAPDGAALPKMLIFILLSMTSPFFTILALNTLFPALAIPSNFYTWLSVIWLHAVVIAGQRAAIRTAGRTVKHD
jgi:hypothetical protein